MAAKKNLEEYLRTGEEKVSTQVEFKIDEEDDGKVSEEQKSKKSQPLERIETIDISKR